MSSVMCKSQLLCISGSCQKFLRINNSQLWRNKWPDSSAQTHQLSLKVVCGPLKSPPQSVLRIASEWVMICRHVLFIMNGENTNTKDGAFYINVPSTLNFYVFGCWGCCDPPPRDEGLQYCEQCCAVWCCGVRCCFFSKELGFDLPSILALPALHHLEMMPSYFKSNRD